MRRIPLKHVGLFGIALLAIFINNFPVFYSFGGSETVGPIKFINGQFKSNPNTYLHHILEYKSQIPFMKFSAWFAGVFNLEPHYADAVYALIISFLVFLAILFFLKSLSVGFLQAWFFALWFITINPFREVIYGYHYKIGTGGSTSGLIAFSLMTLLLYSLYAKKTLFHCILLLVLFAVHPLNTLLYTGFFVIYALLSIFSRNDQRPRIVAEFLPQFLIVILILGLAFYKYGAIQGQEQQKLFVLLALVNGVGKSGAYALPWMNPKHLTNALVLYPSFFIFLAYALRYKLLNRPFVFFAKTFAGYTLALCIIHFLFYKLGASSLLSLNPSRLFILQIPLVFVAVAAVIYKVFLIEKRRNIAMISVLLLACLKYAFYLFPLPLFLLIKGKEVHLRRYIALIGLVIIVNILIHLDTHLPIKDQFIFQNKVNTLLLLTMMILFFGYRFFGKNFRTGLVALFMSLFIMGYRHIDEYAGRLSKCRDRSSEYTFLQEYLDQNSSKDDLVIALDNTFSYNGIRPSFANLNFLTYAIYMGNLGFLENEIRLLWDIDFSPAFLDKFYQNSAATDGRIENHMIQTLYHFTPDRLAKIKSAYPHFRYILVNHRKEFISFKNEHLPLRKVFSKGELQLFEVAL